MSSRSALMGWVRERSVLRDRTAALLTSSTLVSSLGFGAYSATLVLFLHRHAGLTLALVGVVLSVSRFAAIPFSLLSGWLSDRISAKIVTLAAECVQGITIAALLMVQGSTAVFVCLVCAAVAETMGGVGRGVIIGQALAGPDRIAISAVLRSVFNGGAIAGSGLAALFMTWDSAGGLLVPLGISAAARFGSAALVLAVRMPADEGATRPRSRLRVAIGDLRYLAVAALCGVLALDQVILTVCLPLLMSDSRDLPGQLVPLLLMFNSLIVILVQPVMSKGAGDLAMGRTSFTRSAIALGVACIAVATVLRGPVWLFVAGCFLAVGVLTFGEMWGATATWIFRYELAMPESQGSYGGVFKLVTSIVAAIGPVAMVGAINLFGAIAWLLMTVMFVASFAALRLIAPTVRVSASG